MKLYFFLCILYFVHKGNQLEVGRAVRDENMLEGEEVYENLIQKIRVMWAALECLSCF